MALIRYYFGTTPKTITEYAEQWQQLVYALRFDGKIKEDHVVKG